MTAPMKMNIPQMGTSIDKTIAVMNTTPLKRKRGRPCTVNLDGRQATIKKWVPKVWKPVYEQIVALDCMNVPHTDLAIQFDYTKQMISMIVNTPQAKILRRKMLDLLARKNEDFQVKRFEAASSKAMQRINDFMDDDSLYEDNPFAVVEKSLKLLQAKGILKSGNGVFKEGDTHIHGNVTVKKVSQLAENAMIEIKDGLRLIKETDALHENMEAIDVTSPVIDDGRMR